MPINDKYEFKIIRGDGEEVVVSKMFPDGADMYKVVDLFKVFLKAVTFSDNTIESVFSEDYQDDY